MSVRGCRAVRAAGFHEGELAVQRRAGVTAEAARLAGMLAEPDLDGGGHRFLAERTFAVLTARDSGGLLWSAPLIGPAGFLDGHGTVLDIQADLRPGDPLAALPAGQPVGVLAIDFAIRRRMRVNGTLISHRPGQLLISVDQAYGNCPQYIQQRLIEAPLTAASAATGSVASAGSVSRTGTKLTPAQSRIVRNADTFFLGTTHPDRGSDASHRGGPAGFVREEAGTLWWPDYPGNNMFNSLGNLAVDATASLLFVDFGTGQTLHLSGAAEVEWAEPGSPGDDGFTGRRIRFTPRQVIQPAEALPIHATSASPYRHNPRIGR
jgi:predicted pyridoxine 5'-phosphate oxidase superfamily flavin-nucleotide-binding protein